MFVRARMPAIEMKFRQVGRILPFFREFIDENDEVMDDLSKFSRGSYQEKLRKC